LVSGAIGEELAVEAMRAGAQDYVMKDRLTRLVPAIEREVREAQGRRDRRLTQRELAAIVESSEDAIIGRNLQGHVTAWNAGARQLFGYEAADMLGDTLTRLLPPERAAEEDALLERLRIGEKVAPVETVRVARDGRRIDVSLKISPVRDSRRLMGVSEIVRDITDRKMVEAAQAAWQTELERLVTERTEDVRTAHRELQAAFEQQRELEGQITEAAEREQARLGAELHDGVCQQLTGISYLLQTLELQLHGQPINVTHTLERIEKIAQQSIREARALAKGFYPVDLQRLGLVAVLEDLTRSAASGTARVGSGRHGQTGNGCGGARVGAPGERGHPAVPHRPRGIVQRLQTCAGPADRRAPRGHPRGVGAHGHRRRDRWADDAGRGRWDGFTDHASPVGTDRGPLDRRATSAPRDASALPGTADQTTRRRAAFLLAAIPTAS
jgi:PAS domain S-box-containing protein